MDKEMENTTGKIVTGVVAGMLIGTTITLLAAPNTGKDSRQAIGNKITSFRRRYSKKCYQSLVAFLQKATPKSSTSALSGQEKNSSLSRREKEVLQKVAEGFPNWDIARSLGIRATSVSRHLGHIYRKLDVPDRTSAAAWTVHGGLVAAEDSSGSTPLQRIDAQ